MFIRHLELNSRNATCLTPISSSTQGICSELKSRNPTIPPLKYHQKPCRSRMQNPTTLGCSSKIAWHGTRTAGCSRFQTAWRETHTARRLVPLHICRCTYRLAEITLSPGTTLSQPPLDLCLSPNRTLNTVATCTICYLDLSYRLHHFTIDLIPLKQNPHLFIVYSDPNPNISNCYLQHMCLPIKMFLYV